MTGRRNHGAPVAPDPHELGRAAATVRADGHRIVAWSFFTSSNRRASLGGKDGRLGGAHAPMTLGESAGARYLLVWDDGRVGRGVLERRLLDGDAAGALARSRDAAIEDPDAAHVRGPASMPDTRTHDDAVAGLSAGGDAGRAIARLTRVAGIARDLDASTWSGSVGATTSVSRLATSAGLDAHGRGTSYGWSASLDGITGDGWSSRREDDDDAFERRLEALRARLIQLRRAADPPEPGVIPILLHPGVVEAFVLPVLFHNLSGSTVDHGDGAFSREAFERRDRVLREDLDLAVDPLRPLRSGSYRFTTEGVPARRQAFVRGGRLITPVLDVKYARRLGRSPTAIVAAWDAVTFRLGRPIDQDEAVAATAGTVLSVLGVHTQDFGSGDFSLSAPQILRHGGDGPVGRVRGTLAGNLLDLLRHGATRTVTVPGETTPGLVIRCRVDAHRP
jgi:hypothetical protein